MRLAGTPRAPVDGSLRILNQRDKKMNALSQDRGSHSRTEKGPEVTRLGKAFLALAIPIRGEFFSPPATERSSTWPSLTILKHNEESAATFPEAVFLLSS
jgi:hypothetical protein